MAAARSGHGVRSKGSGTNMEDSFGGRAASILREMAGVNRVDLDMDFTDAVRECVEK